MRQDSIKTIVDQANGDGRPSTDCYHDQNLQSILRLTVKLLKSAMEE